MESYQFTKNPVTTECPGGDGQLCLQAVNRNPLQTRQLYKSEKMWKNVQGFEKFLEWWRHCASEGKKVESASGSEKETHVT